jgi:hypothetical protein
MDVLPFDDIPLQDAHLATFNSSYMIGTIERFARFNSASRRSWFDLPHAQLAPPATSRRHELD